MLETWFCTSFSAGISFQVAKKTLRSTRKKKFESATIFLLKWNQENLERKRSEPRADAGERVNLRKLMVKRRRDSALVPRGFTARPSRVLSIYYDSKET